MGIHRLSHIGLCVSDLTASLDFYCGGLGFDEVHRMTVESPEASRPLQLEDVKLEAVYLERDGTCIELLSYPSPGTCGTGEPRAMNEVGLTHLSFRVLDLDAAIARLEEHGARVVRDGEVRNVLFGSAAVFVLDPDGTRVELFQAPGNPDRLPGAK